MVLEPSLLQELEQPSQLERLLLVLPAHLAVAVPLEQHLLACLVVEVELFLMAYHLVGQELALLTYRSQQTLLVEAVGLHQLPWQGRLRQEALQPEAQELCQPSS